ncbi:MAG: carboxymuconolactone decarboxylase family protein [Bdellovibrionales bacterium]|nr:carboxymuconolactone decarboxylase family protein [Bdellovibrionales bacterium]
MSRLNHMELSPSASNALFAFSKAVEALPIDPKIKHLVKIRASQLNGCLFCTDMHIKEAVIHDERLLRIFHLTTWRESELYTPKEKAALEWTELLTRFEPHGVTDEQYQSALKHFSEEELSNLTYAVAIINTWNRFGVAFQPQAGAKDKMLGLDKAGLI